MTLLSLSLTLWMSWISQSPEDLIRIKSVGDLSEVDRSITRVAVEMRKPGLIDFVVDHLPELVYLDLHHSGNKIAPESVEKLAELNKLEHFIFRGDPFLYDREFAALGRMKSIKILRMSLP